MVKSLEDGEVIFAGFYDASVQTLTSDMDAEMIKAMCTPAGGEVVERGVCSVRVPVRHVETGGVAVSFLLPLL